MSIDTIYMILALIVLLVGIVLAFFGKAIWGSLMSMIGGMIGWFLGFFFATYMGWGWIIAIIVGFICAFIGSILFRYLVEISLAFITGLLAGGLFFVAFPNLLIVAVIIFAVVFILAYVYIEEVVAFITALIGALLSGAAIYYLTTSEGMAVLGAILIFLGGALVQTIALKDHDAFENMD